MQGKEMEVFLHIPKCGGSTIRQYYSSAFKGRFLQIGNDHLPSRKFHEYRDFSKVSAIVGHLTARALLSNPFFEAFAERDISVHSVVRDPIDRLISNYNFIVFNPKHPRHAEFQNISGRKVVMDYEANSQYAFLGGGTVFSSPDEICQAFKVISLDRSISYFSDYFKSRIAEVSKHAAKANVTSVRFPDSKGKLLSRSMFTESDLDELSEKHSVDVRLLEIASISR